MTLNLNNAAMLALLENDVEAFNKYRKDNPDQPMDFYKAAFWDADLQGADLRDASLRYANLRGAALWGASLRGADLWAADLTGADLTGADLEGADLEGADLWGADLTGADLTGADLRNVSFSRAKLKGAKLPYDAPALPNIHNKLAQVVDKDNLDMEVWHTCETTHCRAGWVVTLAGEKGKELEEKIGTNAAAALIYMASDPELEKIPDWAADNEDALADIQAMAAK